MRVVKVFSHKRYSTHGSANLVIPENIYELVGRYIEVHQPKPLPQNEDIVFLTSSGRRITRLSADQKELTKRIGHNVTAVMATDMQKGTCTHIGPREDDATARKVVSHMTHKHSTAQAHYWHSYELRGMRKSRIERERWKLSITVQRSLLFSLQKRDKGKPGHGRRKMLRERFRLDANSKPPSVGDCREYAGECWATKTGQSCHTQRAPQF